VFTWCVLCPEFNPSAAKRKKERKKRKSPFIPLPSWPECPAWRASVNVHCKVDALPSGLRVLAPAQGCVENPEKLKKLAVRDTQSHTPLSRDRTVQWSILVSLWGRGTLLFAICC
jgi:hypothetical protein